MPLKSSKKFKPLLLIAILISGIFSAAYLLGWSTLLTVNEVRIQGSTATEVILSELRRRELEPIAGQKLARVEIRSVKRVLSDLDWLSSAEVSRNWFSKRIEIKVVLS